MNKIEIASAMITNRNNELLVVRKKGSSFYMLPGGKIEPKETPILTLLRELDEELGIQFTSEDFEYLDKHSTKAVNEQDTIVTGHIFRLKYELSKSPNIHAELEELSWLNPSNHNNYKLAHLLKEFALPRWLEKN